MQNFERACKPAEVVHAWMRVSILIMKSASDNSVSKRPLSLTPTRKQRAYLDPNLKALFGHILSAFGSSCFSQKQAAHDKG